MQSHYCLLYTWSWTYLHRLAFIYIWHLCVVLPCAPPPLISFIANVSALKIYLKIKLLIIIMNVIIFALILSANPRESLSCSEKKIFTKERRLSLFLFVWNVNDHACRGLIVTLLIDHPSFILRMGHTLWLKEIVDQNSMKWHQQRQEHDEDQSPQRWERSVMEKDFRKRLYVSQCTNKNTSVIHENKFILRYCIALNVLIT